MAHTYNLRSRINSPPVPARSPLVATTPSIKTVTNRLQSSGVSLRLDHVIGTTTKNPSGLAACPGTNAFAYCAGSVAVLAHVDGSGSVSHRYFRARPAAVPMNPSTSYYTTPVSTPTRKRTSFMTPRRDQENGTPSRGFAEDENARTWTARERIKTAKSVALSPNGRYLAVGEYGYNPRVLLFSTTQEAGTEVPLSIVTEHTWGVKSVAFSPDSRFLATLGETNDGFLFIWHVHPKTGALRLCATNKCTSNICHITWCGQQLITVGTRHVKVWQLPGTERSSPSKRSLIRDIMTASPAGAVSPLGGRNCLLGGLVDVTFTCAVSLDDKHALICTDNGSLCLLDVTSVPADLIPLDPDFCPAGAIGFREKDRRLVWAGGGLDTFMQDIDVDKLLALRNESGTAERQEEPLLSRDDQRPKRSTLRQSLGISQLRHTGMIALCCLDRHDIYVDQDANLVVSSNCADITLPSNPLSSHNQPVQGVQALDPKAGLGSFYTWSKTGEIRFWDCDARLLRVTQIELDEGSDFEETASNELRVLRYSNRGYFLSGDRYGVIKLTRSQDWQLCHTARAHSTEVNDICFDHLSEYVASCSRDRMVQVFTAKPNSIELLQTTDDHIAAVNQLGFSNDGNCLLSCSADRTIVVREKVVRGSDREMFVAFLQVRIITIKASPLSMAIVQDKNDLLYVSALDRQITKIDFQTGTVLESFKVSDVDTDDHAVLNAIQVVPSAEISGQRSLLIGCSSTDKSVRIYDRQKQVLLSKESAHTEGISDIALITGLGQEGQVKKSFVSTGHDSTIMLWSVLTTPQLSMTPTIELAQEQISLGAGNDQVPAKPSPATLPPLRKVLTKVDIAEFARSITSRSPSLRDPSPARSLRRTTSRLTLATSAIQEGDESSGHPLRRRASADDRAKEQRRSPSPPVYATRRQKKESARGQVTKDFFTRQSEWLTKSPEAEDSSVKGKSTETKPNKSRLRRPPSVPTDLRSKTYVRERRPSTLPPPVDFGQVNAASDTACRALKTYRKKLETSFGEHDLTNIERELEATLSVIRQKKAAKQATIMKSPQLSKPKLTRSTTSTSQMTLVVRKQSVSTTGSGSNSPVSGSAMSSGSEATEKGHKGYAGLGVDGLSVLLERTNLVEA